MPSFAKIALIIALSLIVTAPAEAAKKQTAKNLVTPLGATYSLYAGGLRVVDVDLTYALGNNAYSMAATGHTRGLWSDLVPWSTSILTQGKVGKASIQPSMAVYDTYWRSKLKSVRILFSAKGDITVESKPPIMFDSRREVTPAQKAGAIDPLAAVAEVLVRMDSNAPACAGKIKAFDGRRLYNLVLNDKGIETLKENRYSRFSGPATRCEIVFEPLAGFPKKDDKSGFWSAQENSKKSNPLIIWLAKPEGAGGKTLPVRLQSRGSYGTVIAHLTGLRDLPPTTLKTR